MHVPKNTGLGYMLRPIYFSFCFSQHTLIHTIHLAPPRIYTHYTMVFSKFARSALLLIACFACFCSGYTISGQLDESILPLTAADFQTTTLMLLAPNAAPIETFLKKSGQFTFSNVSVGSYVLHLQSITLTAESDYRVVVLKDQVLVNKLFAGHDWQKDVGPVVDYPITLEPIIRNDFIEKRESFSPFKMLKSPMVLLTVLSLGMVFVMPKILDKLESMGTY